MPKTETHNAILLRPPPGTRFSIFGADVELQFERGREMEIVHWMQNWIDSYVIPEIEQSLRGPVDPNPEVTALQQQLEKARNPGITQSEQKMAAIGLKPTPANAPAFVPTTPLSVNLPKAGVPVVYGPMGAMSAEEIRNLPDQPIQGRYGVSKPISAAPVSPHAPTESPPAAEVQGTADQNAFTNESEDETETDYSDDEG